eukprot:1339990-Amorphochlora_amoeboformis.AAC.1
MVLSQMLVWSTARVSRLLLQRGLGTTPRIRRLSIAPYGHIDLKKLQHQVDEYKTDNFLLQDFANALPSIPSNHVFANADTSLAHISHYGFDYDYTLATYNKNLPHLIYDLAKVSHSISMRMKLSFYSTSQHTLSYGLICTRQSADSSD